MKILFILEEPYPNGMACTKRIHLYAKGLKELENDVLIVVPKPTEQNDSIKNDCIKGIYEGINYLYSSKNTVRSNSFIKRRFDDFFAMFNLVIISLKFKPHITLLISNSNLKAFVGKIISVFTKSKYIREKSEIPYFNKENVSFFHKLILKTNFNLFDGLVVISKNLYNYFKEELKIKSKVIVVPIISEYKEHQVKDSYKFKKYFAYTGSLNDSKDGIIEIIKAFALISQKYDSIKLIMTGDLNRSKKREKIKKLILDNKLQKRVIFTGFVTEKELDIIRKNAIALLLAKPVNKQNKYNMATKIAEYLFSETAVILSNVDPASNYLCHRLNACVVNPDSKSFADEMKYLIENPNQRENIGLEGYKVAKQSFMYSSQALRINDFLRRLLYEN